MIDKYPHKYKELVAKLGHANYRTKYLFGSRKSTKIIVRLESISVLTTFRKYEVNRYKTCLLYPILNLTTDTFSQL